MKKAVTLALSTVLASAAVLAGCGEDKDSAAPSAAATAAASTAATASPQASTAPKAEPFTVSLRHIQIGEAQKFRSKADRKGLRTNAAPSRHQIMAHLMHEYDDCKNEKERYNCPDKQAFTAEEKGQSLLQITTPYKSPVDRSQPGLARRSSYSTNRLPLRN